MSFGNWAENAAIDWLFGGATPIRPAARYVSLHTADPGDTGTSEQNGTNDLGYARKAITLRQLLEVLQLIMGLLLLGLPLILGIGQQVLTLACGALLLVGTSSVEAFS